MICGDFNASRHAWRTVLSTVGRSLSMR